MPLEKAEYGEFIYIAYARKGYPDYEKLKRSLDNSISHICQSKGVVVDFTNCPDIGSPEMAALVRLVRTLQELHRVVHVVAPDGVRERLVSVNLHRLPYVAIHNCLKEAIETIKATK